MGKITENLNEMGSVQVKICTWDLPGTKWDCKLHDNIWLQILLASEFYRNGHFGYIYLESNVGI